jgi:hypothetical protein
MFGGTLACALAQAALVMLDVVLVPSGTETVLVGELLDDVVVIAAGVVVATVVGVKTVSALLLLPPPPQAVNVPQASNMLYNAAWRVGSNRRVRRKNMV